MGNNVQVFNNKELGLQVRTLPNPDGSISISAEDTAIGFGWCRTEKRNGKEYTSIRWERMNGFSEECGLHSRITVLSSWNEGKKPSS